ncbi:MAG TPA: hypothetical protein VND64_23705 [Pirellulales bacterium]|nr:hypothetical protein [Pirellulales bacterium]
MESASKELGVRCPPGPHADVDLDSAGHVLLNGRGMSVAENWRYLPPHLIPKRLLPLVPDASGSNQLFCWSMGNGPFVNDSVNESLALRIKPHMPNMGNVVPIEPVAVDRFQLDLAATRNQWQPDE